MGSSDNFCLRWNDFESNISTSFRELREDSEFFDVSLCCDNGTDVVPAHKVILAACSPLFRKILSRQKNQQNPFLYLKGIHLKELQAVLNFMYHGEVNVAQDSLNNFLAVAEELAVKGLTTDSKPGSEPISTPSGSSKKAVPPKRKPPQTPSGSTHPSPSTSAKKPKISQADDVVDIDPHDVDIKSIKAEPEPSGSGGGVGASGAVAHGGPDPDLGDDSYAGDQDDNGDFGAGEDFEGFEQYGDGAEFDDSMAGAAAAGGSGAAADGKVAVFVRNVKGPSTTTYLLDSLQFVYQCSDIQGSCVHWRCLANGSKKCPAKAITIGNDITETIGFHNHSPNYDFKTMIIVPQ